MVRASRSNAPLPNNGFTTGSANNMAPTVAGITNKLFKLIASDTEIFNPLPSGDRFSYQRNLVN